MRAFLSALVLMVQPVAADELIVFAAASLAGPLDRAVELWEEETGRSVSISYAGSSALARQIEAGAPADLVFLASADWATHLAEADLLVAETVTPVLTNRLVAISATPEDEVITLAALTDALPGRRLAIALSEAVPAGIYARAALEHFGLWDAASPHLVEADNVRAALSLVAIGAVQYGIVYASDARLDERVDLLFEIPSHAHPPIEYPLACVTKCDPAAESLRAFLQSAAAVRHFRDAGFGIWTE